MDEKRVWKLGIIGWPLGYSLSPLMHNAALKACGLQGEYREIPVKPEDLDRWLREEAPKLDGFNVTMPHKQAVYHWLKQYGEVLNLLLWKIEAVNTVRRKKDRTHLVGTDTDGAGFFYGLSYQQRVALVGKTVILLGAGGAAEAIAETLLQTGKIGSLKIWNRHPERAESLAEELTQSTADAVGKISTLSDLCAIGDCDLLVNATPAGMKGYEELPLDYSRLREGQIVYDIVYEPRETRLIREARQRGCAVVTGDRMLAGQGAVAFAYWTRGDLETRSGTWGISATGGAGGEASAAAPAGPPDGGPRTDGGECPPATGPVAEGATKNPGHLRSGFGMVSRASVEKVLPVMQQALDDYYRTHE